MLTILRNYFNKSIGRLVMTSFIFVLLFPLGFLALSLPEDSWEGVKDEVMKKHVLIAKNIESSINYYYSSIQKNAQVFANTAYITNISDKNILQSLLDDYVNTLDNVVVASYLSLKNNANVISIEDSYKGSVDNSDSFGKEPNLSYLHYGKDHHRISAVSPVFRSSVSNKPVVLVKTYLKDRNNINRAILFAEVNLSYVNGLCQNINSTKHELCIVVDSKGKVISHPDQKLVNSIKDISNLKVIQKLSSIQSSSGTMNYQTHNSQHDVLSGFTKIKNLGWGIVISQPNKALDTPLNEVKISIVKWLLIGIALALSIAFLLAKQITRPIKSLARRASEANIRSTNFNLGKVPKNTPAEISQLWVAISSLVTRLQITNRKVIKLNYSLSKDIKEATKKLRASNKHLYAISSKDHLTNIANRRYFEDITGKIIERKIGEKASVILIDVDKFKFINDTYGHEAGDLALIHIAKLMKECTRNGDLAARLGGDEFVIYIRNCHANSLQKIAENLRKTVERSPINWGGKLVKLTLSIGTVNCVIDQQTSLTSLLKQADEAMYLSKKKGRNSVSTYSSSPGRRKSTATA